MPLSAVEGWDHKSNARRDCFVLIRQDKPETRAVKHAASKITPALFVKYPHPLFRLSTNLIRIYQHNPASLVLFLPLFLTHSTASFIFEISILSIFDFRNDIRSRTTIVSCYSLKHLPNTIVSQSDHSRNTRRLTFVLISR
jgi:hypothetical protein